MLPVMQIMVRCASVLQVRVLLRGSVTDNCAVRLQRVAGLAYAAYGQRSTTMHAI